MRSAEEMSWNGCRRQFLNQPLPCVYNRQALSPVNRALFHLLTRSVVILPLQYSHLKPACGEREKEEEEEEKEGVESAITRLPDQYSEHLQQHCHSP